MKKLHIICLLLIWSFSYSQHYTNYTTKDGLPSNHVYRITQDYKGFIWFLTDEGIVKYNGTTFKTFTTKEGLPTNDIWDVRIGHDNKIWFFAKASKLGYIENDKVTTFESEQKGEILYPRIIGQNKNEIFFSNTEKDYYLEENLWKFKTKSTNFGYGDVLNHHLIKNIFVKLERDSLLIFNKKNTLIKTLKLDNYISNSGRYRGQISDSLFCWIGNKTIRFLNLNTLKLTENKFNFIPSKHIRYSSVNNTLQISGENFVAFLDANLQVKNRLDIPEKFNSHFSFIDKNNNLWVATFSNGVYFLPASKRASKYNLQDEKVSKIQKVNNQIIASVYKKGFYKYDFSQKIFKPYLAINDFIFSAK